MERYAREENTFGPCSNELVREQVLARLSIAVMGIVTQEISSVLCEEQFESTPLLDPPIVTDLTESVKNIHDIRLEERSGLTRRIGTGML